MATKHLGILLAMKAAIVAAGIAGAPPITVGRTRPISQETAQAVNLNLVSSAVAIGLTGGRTGWMTLVEVEHYGRGTGDTSGIEAVDPLVQAVYHALLTDNTLGGLAEDINPAEGDTLRWEDDEQAENLCVCTARFMVLHMNADRTLS
jgi:hypothetical protein